MNNEKALEMKIDANDYSCAICQETLFTLEPIRCCIHGHNFHQQCLFYCLQLEYKPKLSNNINLNEVFEKNFINCPVCRVNCITARNLMLEQLLTKFSIKCRNFKCDFISQETNSMSIYQHETICSKRDYISSYSDEKFKWTNRIDYLISEINGFNSRRNNTIVPIISEMQPSEDNRIDFVTFLNYEENFTKQNQFMVKLEHEIPNIIIFNLQIHIALHAVIFKERVVARRIHIFNPLELSFNIKYEAIYNSTIGNKEKRKVSHHNVKLFDIEIQGDRYISYGSKQDIPFYYCENVKGTYFVSLSFKKTPEIDKKTSCMSEEEMYDIKKNTILYTINNEEIDFNELPFQIKLNSEQNNNSHTNLPN